MSPSHWPAHLPLPQGDRGVVTGTQVPRLAVLRHDSHCPVQAKLQHTPSDEQVPLAHSVLTLQASPFLLAMQVPFSQTGVLPPQPPQHCASGIQAPSHGFCPAGQLPAQVVPPGWQPNWHDIVVEGEHAPLPLQTAAVVAVPFVHEAAAPHGVVLVG